MRHKKFDEIGSIYNTLAVVIIVISLIASATYFMFFYGPDEIAEPNLVIEKEHAVEVDYIGTFEDGRVFDTSLESVADDNITYPKSYSFQHRGKGGYTPLAFKVGAGQMIAGFDEGVLGMKEGETKMLEIPPNKGYGESDVSIIHEMPLIEEIPVKEFTNVTNWRDVIGDVLPLTGAQYEHPVWGWNVTIAYVLEDEIMFFNQPYVGEIVSPYSDWESEVVEIDSSANGGDGAIKVKHKIDVSQAGKIGGLDDVGEFIISEINEETGIALKDYNRETVGKTLYFRVTIVKIRTE